MKKVCVVIGSRANYSSIRSAMKAIQKHSKLDLQIVCLASATLAKYGLVAEIIQEDGFFVNQSINTLLEGENLVSMAKSTGLCLIELPTVFLSLKPDLVLTVGDRFETIATAIAASYMNIPLAHTMGGEVTGTIDESIRHAITKFANIHFPASSDARTRIIKLGEDPKTIFTVGCPRIDLVKDAIADNSIDVTSIVNELGVGSSKLDLSEPFLIISQHPVTTEYMKNEHNMTESLKAVEKAGIQTIVLWPNADAGSDGISRAIRKWREQNRGGKIRFIKNLQPKVYSILMNKTSCLVGNSSSGIREGAYLGTPVVNIGSRQNTRERGKNVIDTVHESRLIHSAVQRQLDHGRYLTETIYGDGTAGEQIAEVLSTASVKLQKRITY